jgi:hypothetical protein
MDFLTAEEKLLMQTDATDLIGDLELSPPITYRAHGGQTFVPSTGQVIVTWTDFTIGAIRNELSAREVAASNGLYQMGDLRFLIRRSLLPVTPDKEDRIIVDGVTYEIVSWGSDPIELFWRMVARAAGV